jgi:hypothetical protein
MTDKEFAKSVSSTEEFLVCTVLLPAIRERYGTSFALLEIPEVLRSDRSASQYGTVYFRDYDGEKYNGRWSEQPGEFTGGCALGTELSSEMVLLLKDLQQIDVGWLLSLHPVGKNLERSAFDLRSWLLSFERQRTIAVEMGISEEELKQAEESVSDGFQLTRRIVSNGDFYPRNLIKLPKRMVLADWGYWAGYRACFVDDLVNVAAFAFIHMWNNVPWQNEFVDHLGETFGIKREDLRRAILVKSFEQATYWRCLPQLFPSQVNLFKMAVRNEIPG